MTDIISIVHAGGRWAVKHDGGYLGFAQTREEARRIRLHLVDWIGHRGRDANFIEEEPRSFAPLAAADKEGAKGRGCEGALGGEKQDARPAGTGRLSLGEVNGSSAGRTSRRRMQHQLGPSFNN